MTPDEAAALLGIGVDAEPGAVRDAFRDRARRAHPDRGGETGLDLAQLTEARDVLLDPPTATDGALPEPVGAPSPAGPTPSTGPPTTSAARRAAASGSFGRLLYGAIATAIGAAIVGAIVIVVVALATGGGDPEEPPARTAECLVVTGDGVAESPCDVPGAQRIVAEYTGARTCPAGSNSLVVAATTWCLESAAP